MCQLYMLELTRLFLWQCLQGRRDNILRPFVAAACCISCFYAGAHTLRATHALWACHRLRRAANAGIERIF